MAVGGGGGLIQNCKCAVWSVFLSQCACCGWK